MAICIGAQAARAADSDEAQIRAQKISYQDAVKAKNVDGIMAVFQQSDDLVIFDVIPPLQYTGIKAWRGNWKGFLDAFPGPVDYKVKDLKIFVSGDMAYSHAFEWGSFTEKSGKKDISTFRATDVWRKIGGKWLVVHEHLSFPVDWATKKAVIDAE